MPCFCEDFRTESERERDRLQAQERRRLALVLDEINSLNGYAVSKFGNCGDLDAMTREACESLKYLEGLSASLAYKDLIAEKSPELRSWWENHKRLDAEREKAEQAEKHRLSLVESAKTKLTLEERKALGF